MGTPEYLNTLTVDQLRFARDYADQKIKAAEASPRRVVWRVTDGIIVVENYREEEYEKAADHMLSIFKARFMAEAPRFIPAKGYTPYMFVEEMPHIVPEHVTQVEYDTEWFPAATA